MIVGIHHIAIGVPDFDRAFTFYTEVLGFEPVEKTEFSGPNPPSPPLKIWAHAPAITAIRISPSRSKTSTLNMRACRKRA